MGVQDIPCSVSPSGRDWLAIRRPILGIFSDWRVTAGFHLEKNPSHSPNFRVAKPPPEF